MKIASISPANFARIGEEGKIVDLVDVRSPVEFREVHVATAQNIPLDSIEPSALMQSRKNAASEPIYFICRSGSRGKQACEKLIAAGHTNVINIEGGTLACVDASLHLVRGKKSMSLERQVRIAAGSFVLLGAVLGWLVHPAFFGLSAFVGAGLIFAGVTDWCGMGMLIAKMPWNQIAKAKPDGAAK